LKKAIVLFSGGLDSLAVLTWLARCNQTLGLIKPQPIYVRWKGEGYCVREVRTVMNLWNKCTKEGFDIPKPLIFSDRKYMMTRDMLPKRNQYMIDWTLERFPGADIGMGEYKGGGPETWVNWWSVSTKDSNTEELQNYIHGKDPQCKLWTLDDIGNATIKCDRVKLCHDQVGDLIYETNSCFYYDRGTIKGRSIPYKLHCGQCYLCVERNVAMLSALGEDKTTYDKDPRESPLFPEYCVQMRYMPGLIWVFKNRPNLLRIPFAQLVSLFDRDSKYEGLNSFDEKRFKEFMNFCIDGLRAGLRKFDSAHFLKDDMFEFGSEELRDHVCYTYFFWLKWEAYKKGVISLNELKEAYNAKAKEPNF